MEVHIKLCNLRHLDAAVDLFEQYRRFYGMPADFGGAHAFLNDRLQNKDSVFLLAVDEENRPLGFTQLYPMFSSTRMVELWVLNDLFVLQAARRLGVGSRLMDAGAQMGKPAQREGTDAGYAKGKRFCQAAVRVLGL